jgi:hypothetical protein
LGKRDAGFRLFPANRIASTVGCWVVSAKLRIGVGEVRRFTPCRLAYGADKVCH